MKNTIIGQFFKIVKEEFSKAEGTNKYLLLIIFANIPIDFIFMGFLTKAISAILIIFYYKKCNEKDTLSKIDKILLLSALLAQLVLIPYIPQLITIILIGILFGNSRKEEVNN